MYSHTVANTECLAQVTVEPVIHVHGDILNVSSDQLAALQAQDLNSVALPLGSIIPRAPVHQQQDDPPPPQPQPPPTAAPTPAPDQAGASSTASEAALVSTPAPHTVAFSAPNSRPQPSSDQAAVGSSASGKSALHAPSQNQGSPPAPEVSAQTQILSTVQHASSVTMAPSMQPNSAGPAVSGGSGLPAAVLPQASEQPNQAAAGPKQATALLAQAQTGPVLGTEVAAGKTMQQLDQLPQLGLLPPKPPPLPANSTVPLQVGHLSPDLIICRWMHVCVLFLRARPVSSCPNAQMTLLWGGSHVQSS